MKKSATSLPWSSNRYWSLIFVNIKQNRHLIQDYVGEDLSDYSKALVNKEDLNKQHADQLLQNFKGMVSFSCLSYNIVYSWNGSMIKTRYKSNV